MCGAFLIPWLTGPADFYNAAAFNALFSLSERRTIGSLLSRCSASILKNISQFHTNAVEEIAFSSPIGLELYIARATKRQRHSPSCNLCTCIFFFSLLFVIFSITY